MAQQQEDTKAPPAAPAGDAVSEAKLIEMQKEYECVVMMEEFLEILKLLNYENRFCKQKGFKPFTKTYFCYQTPNSADQFKSFDYIAVWLLSLNGVQISSWNKYDDPTAVSNNIILELTKLGITFDFPPNKLKSGAGEAVCQLLLKLAQRALKQQKFAFSAPSVEKEDAKSKEDGGIQGEDDDVDENMENKDLPGDDLENGEGGKHDEDGAKKENENEDDHAIMESKLKPEEWQKECERVSSRLKISAPSDASEWRTHLEQAKKYSQKVSESLPEAKSKIEKKADELAKLLEKISSKEKVINKNFSHIVEDYKVTAEALKDVTQKVNQLNEVYQKQQQHLQEITDRLEEIQVKMNVQGDNISDATPLMRIKKSIHAMRQEILHLEIRLGVVGNTLMKDGLF